MRLVVDLRRAFDSGLGTYVRETVPRTLARLGGATAAGIVGAGEERRHREAYLGDCRIECLECPAGPLTLAEQWWLRQIAPAGTLLWVTSLAHPLFWRGPLAATVHDVLQLARPETCGHARRIAAGLYLANLRKRARLLMFNSAFTRDEFARWVGIPVGRQAVTPLGVDTRTWCPSSMPGPRIGDAPPYFLFVGNLRKHKNLPVLLEAFRMVRDAIPHELRLVGRAFADSRGIEPMRADAGSDNSRVRWLGELPADQLLEVMRGATALIVPSLYEGFGLPVLEGMATGCPVVASRAAALGETGAGAARYFDPARPDDLARLLVEAAREPADARAQWVRSGLQRAASFSWDRTADLTAAALESVMT